MDSTFLEMSSSAHPFCHPDELEETNSVID
jgi:hypothetical protein